MNSVGQEIYDDSVSLGRIMTFIGKVILSILGIITIILGAVLIGTKDQEIVIDGQPQPPRNVYKGATFILIGLLMIGFGFFVDYLSHRYKFFAAGEGVGTIFRLFR
jgi:sterol desaturase/sphingolipid hydroxylase (fatty acid hydroxylase superfamily)